jgi:stage II sporulation protein AA (anti-sigma F factor antagonist)
MDDLVFRNRSSLLAAERDGASVAVHPEHLGIRLSVHGYLDLDTSPRLGHRIRKALTLPIDRLAIDLHDVEFVDSSGLNVLNDARLATKRRDMALVLVSPAPCVRRLLDLTAMTDRFDIRAK